MIETMHEPGFGAQLSVWARLFSLQNRKGRRTRLALFLAVAIGAIFPAESWADETVGRVGYIQANPSGFQFALAGYPALCTQTAGAYGFLGAGYDPDAAKVMIASLWAAKLSGARVRVFATNAPGGWGCVVNAVNIDE
jgi:hypothetical protein